LGWKKVAQFGSESVAQITPECLAQFAPERVAQFAAESVAGLLRNMQIPLLLHIRVINSALIDLFVDVFIEPPLFL
jgi:hypothetical protein